MNQYLYYNRNYILRKFLNTQENSNIIKDLISAILDINIKTIIVNTYKQEESIEISQGKSLGVVDVRIEISNNKEYNIGIQFLDGKHIQSKIALYYLYVHSKQMYYNRERGTSRTITINFLDFPYYRNTGYHKKAILNKFRTIDFSGEQAEAHIIELPKFKILNPQKMTKQEQWISYLRGENEAIIKNVKSHNQNIQQLDKMVQKYWENEKI